MSVTDIRRTGKAVSRRAAAARAQTGTTTAVPLGRNFAWTFLGNCVYAGCQWGMVIALAKLGTVEMLGQFALGLAVSAPVMLLASLHLRGLQATDVAREFAFADYLGLRLASTAAALGVIALIGWVVSPRSAPVVLAVGLSKAVESLSDVIFGLFQQRERMDRVARSAMLKGPLSLVAFTAALAAGGSLVGAVLALAAVWTAVLVGYDLPAARRELARAGRHGRLVPRFHPPTLRRLFRLAAPLGVVMFLLSLQSNLPRFFLGWYWGERELGIFAAMAWFVAIGTQVMTALGQSASPRLARHWAEGDRAAFHRLVRRLLAVGAAAGTLGVATAAVFGRPLLGALYRPEYAGHPAVFVCVMGAGGLLYLNSVLGFAATASRRIAGQPVVLGACVTLSLAACAALVPPWGMLGGALAMLATAAALVVGYGVLLVRSPRKGP
ncbi:MAG: oligosaccharide flippase family protein [Thermoguttaceae bacterium]|jgi:O-antigen/teichoic acid export membrane protein|nr:oligosaccharide flippase family protein [Thermoguttaceae bacterium]